MLYLILVVCALSLGAEAQNCNCSIANLPQCLLPNTTVPSNATSNATNSLLCIVADVYNLVNGVTGGTGTNVVAVVVDVLLIVFNLLRSLDFQVTDLIDSLEDIVENCKLENSGLGNDLQTILDTLLGAVTSIVRSLLRVVPGLLG